MFDAKSILEGIVRGAAPAGPSNTPHPNGNGAPAGGSIGDILNDILRNTGAGGQSAQTGTGSGGSVGDILNQISRSLTQAQTKSPSAVEPGQPAQTTSSPDFGNILSQIRDTLSGAGGSAAGGSSIGDILSRVFTQATQGVKEGSQRIGQETGASDALGRLASDPQTAQMLEKLKGLVQNNPQASSAAAGGLGGLLLGTRTGRSVAANAAKLGAIAMIGGLAYKAIQNYQKGAPLLSGAQSEEGREGLRMAGVDTTIEPPPAGSGFEPAAMTNDAAVHYLQAMIAAAYADGRLDPDEREAIMSSLKGAGLDSESQTFLASELDRPHSVQDLAASVQTPQEAIQLYTMARIAVADDSPAEERFLSALSQELGLDPRLAAQIDSTARAAV